MQARVLVNEFGQIVNIVQDAESAITNDELLRQTGWNVADTTIFQARENEFFCPGFVGVCANMKALVIV